VVTCIGGGATGSEGSDGGGTTSRHIFLGGNISIGGGGDAGAKKCLWEQRDGNVMWGRLLCEQCSPLDQARRCIFQMRSRTIRSLRGLRR
jgi:hypothetical protein